VEPPPGLSKREDRALGSHHCGDYIRRGVERGSAAGARSPAPAGGSGLDPGDQQGFQASYTIVDAFQATYPLTRSAGPARVSTIVNEEAGSPLGGQLALVRQARGQSLKLVATRAGISPAYLHKLERGGVRHPSPPVLTRLASALGVDYEQLMELAGYTVHEVGGLERRSSARWLLVTPAGTDTLTEDEGRELVEYLAWRRYREGRRQSSPDTTTCCAPRRPA
jgi:HTH-type transcriptional regulator, competence development regulator